MGFFSDITLDGRAAKLCLLPIDWRTPPKTTLGVEVDGDEGLSGVESRAAKHHHLRLTSVEYSYRLKGAAAEEFLAEILDLGNALLALPLWPDHKAAAGYEANRVFAAQHWVNYDPATGAYSLDAGSGRARSVGIFAGRLRDQPRITARQDTEGTVTIRVREDSPWESRVAVNTSAMPTWALKPDWRGAPEDFSKTQLKGQQIGAGREQTLTQDHGATKRGQKALFTLTDRVRIRRLLTFFQAQRGSWGTFTIPAWFRPNHAPGVDTMLTVHFGQDEVELTWLTTDAIKTELSFWQDLQLIDGQPSQARPSIAHLYKFWWESSATVMTWTDWESPLVHGGATYAPAKIEHNAPVENLRPGTSEWEIMLRDFDGNPLRAFTLLALERRLHVEIRECDPENAGGAVLRFAGEVATAPSRGGIYTAKAVLLGGRLKRQIPNYYVQTPCNHVFGDDLCGVDVDALAVTGAVTAVAGNVVDVDAGDGAAADDFAYGYVEFGTGEALELRYVIRSEPITGGQRLTLHRPLRALGVGADVRLLPGCDGQFEGGCARHDNQDAFGGEPWLPTYIESVDSGYQIKTGK